MHQSTKSILALAVGVLAANAAMAESYTWKSVVAGGGGFVDGFVFHTASKGILYARTDMGGAYRWNTASESWIPLTDWIGRTSDNYGILSIALDAQDTGKVYLLTGKYTNSWSSEYGYVLASNDGGRTFGQKTALHGKVGGNDDGRGAGERLAVDPNLGTVVMWAGTRWDSVCWGCAVQDTWRRGALWKSSNGAGSFDSVASGPAGNGLYVVFDPSTGTPGSATRTIYASFDSSNAGAPAIWRSKDAGATWAVLAGQPAGLLSNHATVAGNQVFFSFCNGLGPNGVTGGAVWRYNSTDSSWTNISPVKNATFGFGTVSAYSKDPSRLVVSSVDFWNKDEIWLSTDTGATWTKKLTTGKLDNSWAPWSTVRAPHWLASVQFDPFDSSVALFGTGYGVFRTTNLLATSPTWAFADSNFEETVPRQLVSPPSGAPLLSAVGDQGGYRHARLDVAPAFVHLPDVGSTAAIEVAWNKSSTFVKASSSAGKGTTCGAISTDSGKTWTEFPTQPAGLLTPSAANNWAGGGGTRSIAISADASSIVWTAPNTTGPYYSTDAGVTWNASTGGPGAAVISTAQPVADRVNGRKLYVLDQQGGKVYASADGGVTFAAGATKLPTLPSYGTSDGVASTTPGYEGDLWVTTGAGGLWHSTNSAATFKKSAGVSAAYLVGLGKAPAGKSYPAVFIWGVVGGVTGIFRSDDSAATWMRINDDAHQYGTLHHIVGDMNVFGRVYLGTEGRGAIYGEPVGGDAAVSPVVRSVVLLRRVGDAVVSGSKTEIVLVDLAGRPVRMSGIVNGAARLELAGLPRGLYLARSGSDVARVVW